MDAYWFNNLEDDIMSMGLLVASIILMGCGAGLVIVMAPFLFKTVEEPEFMKEERPDMYESVDLEV